MDARTLVAASRFWGRRFTRVVEVRRVANVTLRLAEARPDGGERFRWLRLCRHPATTGSNLGFEPRVLQAVKSGPELAVVRPLAGCRGRLRTRLPWDGAMRHACLFDAAPGREMLPCPDDVRRFRRALAALHDALPAARGSPLRRIEAGASCHAAASWLRRAGPDAAAIADDAERAAPVLRSALEAAGPGIGLCHGDARLGNALLDGECVTFLDFEGCAVGPLALDLATMAVWLRRETKAAALWSVLLDGYRSRRVLSSGDLAALPALAALVEIRMAGSLARFWTMPPAMWGEMHVRVRARLDELGATAGRSGAASPRLP